MAVVATSLREMRPEDVPAVAALEERIFPEPWSAATLAAELWLSARGVGYIRTHDPAALSDGIKVWRALEAEG